MSSSPQSKYLLAVVFLLVLCALAIKLAYLATAESSYNAEEVAAAAVDLVSQGPSRIDVTTTRLYGTSLITSGLSYYLFGITVFAMKLPNLLFFMASLMVLILLSKRLLPSTSKYLFLIPPLLFALGPPVLQMWGLKNRGGYIESIFALVLCLWVIAKDRGYLDPKKKNLLILSIVIGLATWSQPISLVWGLPLLLFVGIQILTVNPGHFSRATLIAAFGLLVGLMPLVVLNLWFDFNTLTYLSIHEVPIETGDLGFWGRTTEFFQNGLPRLLGLKEQWSSSWLLPTPVSAFFYVFLLLPCLIGTYEVVRSSFKQRKLDIWATIPLIAVVVILANVCTSWGNFQLEPRRLLLLYVPLFLLSARGLKSSRAYAFSYCFVWVIFCSWANFTYIEKYPDGFSTRKYERLDGVSDYLLGEGVTGVYTDFWVGNRLTFSSEGKIQWFRTDYIPTSYGFISDGILGPQNAIIFDPERMSYSSLEKFESDLESDGISCKKQVLDGLHILLGCSDLVDLLSLGALDELVVSFRGSLDVFHSQVGVLTDGGMQSDNRSGFLIYGPYEPFAPGTYQLKVYGTSMSANESFTDIVSRKAEWQHYKAALQPTGGETGLLANGCAIIRIQTQDTEIRVFVGENDKVLVEKLEFAPISGLAQCVESTAKDGGGPAISSGEGQPDEF